MSLSQKDLNALKQNFSTKPGLKTTVGRMCIVRFEGS